MNRERQFSPGWLWLTIAAAGIIMVESHLLSAKKFVAPVNENPQQFHLMATSNSISVTFNCDPRAADEWLYQTAGGNVFDGNTTLTNLMSRRWEQK